MAPTVSPPAERTPDDGGAGAITVGRAVRELFTEPGRVLIRRWNWKSALYSALWRGGIFFFANLSAGGMAALGAMLADSVYRITTSGFYGAATQQISRGRPRWLASIAALIVLPAVSHTIEFLIHWTRGTPNLKRSILLSMSFTAIATLFNVYVMSRGFFTVGPGSRSVIGDFVALYKTIASGRFKRK